MLSITIASLALSALAALGADATKPNIIFILADDLGYGDIGCYGQTKIKTPNIDRMATEGIRFTQAYCGTSVCAPSRCALLTGLHIGHAPVRANRKDGPEGQMPLPAGTFTVAKLLKDAGYRTGCFGKWGLGFVGTTGDPIKNGFDNFFGYNCQTKAHEYYPEYLWRNDDKVELDGKTYSHDLIVAEAFKWLRQNKDQPFFLYLPFTIPHGKYQVPDVGAYANEPWTEAQKTYAAMITRMDGDIGRLLALVKELGVDEKTIIFFTSDNGPAFAPDSPNGKLFNSSAGLHGHKRELYEGGIRAPMIVRWPGHVPAGKESDVPWASYDFLPTCAELADVKIPAGVKADGLSVLSALLGGAGPKREYLYWELHEPNFRQALRAGDWKVIRPAANKPLELYNLRNDPSEQHNLAGDEPERVKKLAALLANAHADSPLWPVENGVAPPGKNKKKQAQEPK
jgi:arylsulfatase A-like enzyme